MTQTITQFATEYAPELAKASWFKPAGSDREGHAYAMADEIGWQLMAARRELANAHIFEAPNRPKPTLTELGAAIALLANLSANLRKDPL